MAVDLAHSTSSFAFQCRTCLAFSFIHKRIVNENLCCVCQVLRDGSRLSSQNFCMLKLFSEKTRFKFVNSLFIRLFSGSVGQKVPVIINVDYIVLRYANQQLTWVAEPF